MDSAQWFRVADVRATLLPQVQVRRQRVRGHTWMVLVDALRGKSVRLSRQAYGLAAGLDGRKSVGQWWEESQAQASEASPAPTQEEALDLLGQLHAQGMLGFSRADDAQLLSSGQGFQSLPEAMASEARTQPFNPLVWRLPLGHPARLLKALAPLQVLWRGRFGLVFWLSLILVWALGSWWMAPQLWAYGPKAMAAPHAAWWALLIYLPVKAIHELAHGLAARQVGAPVGEAGVTLLAGMPVPFVNASASAALARARDRMLVSAAGIVAELGLAAMALMAWALLDDGGLRRLAYAVWLMAGASTLLFNANPLQRMDGYYTLTDALGLPNLATRSRSWWHALWRRCLTGQPDAHDGLVLAPGEKAWLVAYAPLSWIYGMGLMAGLALWLTDVSRVLALVVALLALWQSVCLPVMAAWRSVVQVASAQSFASRQVRVRLALALGALGLLLLMPWPHNLVAQGVVWPSERAQLRNDTAGVVLQVLANDGEVVNEGDVVVVLTNADARTEQAAARARVDRLQTDWVQAQTADAGSVAPDSEQASVLLSQLEAATAELARADERLRGLVVRAQTSGRLVLPQSRDWAGRYLAQGTLVGQVLTNEAPVVRAVVPEDRADEVRRGLKAVSVQLMPGAGDALAAQLHRDTEAAVLHLPSSALSEHFGGSIPTDPADEEHRTALRPVVWMDVALASHASLTRAEQTGSAYLGVRAWVRFDLGWSPLMVQFGQAARRAWQHRSSAAL